MHRLSLLLLASALCLPLNAFSATRTKIPANANQRRILRKEAARNTNTRYTPSQSQKKHSASPEKYISYSEENYHLSIPQSWQCINDKTQLPEKLDMVLIGKGAGGLTPTINIAQETTTKPLADYLAEAIAYHKASETTLNSAIFTTLPAVNCEFTIVKTEKTSSWGKVICLQAIAIANHTAYVFTGTTTLDDYESISLVFLKTVSSFALSETQATSSDAVLEKALKQLTTTP